MAVCRDVYGRYYTCSGLSNGARIGIGVAIAVGVALLIAVLSVLSRRRRAQRFQQTIQPTSYGNNAPGAAGAPPTGYPYGAASPATYPPPQGPNYFHGQQQQQGQYQPPPGMPPTSSDMPSTYAPPPGPPPPTYQPKSEAA